jgi:hypothetical protein
MHPQTWVKVNATVDCGIAEVVSLLNKLPLVRTVESCQGEPGGRAAFVYFEAGDWRETGRVLFDELMPKFREWSDDVRAQLVPFGDHALARLTFSAEAIPVVVSALKSLTYERP